MLRRKGYQRPSAGGETNVGQESSAGARWAALARGMPRPAAAVFDVIETIFPLAPLRPRLAALGLSWGWPTAS